MSHGHSIFIPPNVSLCPAAYQRLGDQLDKVQNGGQGAY
jgi:hypothetical protein